MFWKTLAQDQGHCHGGDHLDGQVQFLILLSSSESFNGELGLFTIVTLFYLCSLHFAILLFSNC